MRPAPMTATFFTLMGSASEECFFIFVMPSNIPISASLSLVAASFANSSRSFLNLSNPLGWDKPYLTHSIMAYGAGYFPFVFLSTIFLILSHIKCCPGGVSSMKRFISDFFLGRLFFTVPFAKPSAVSTATFSRDWGATTKSTKPIFFAFAGRISFPVSIMSIPPCTPTNAGKFCVPPNPGKNPNFTSGNPILVEEASVQIR
mmetsp:Transcript_9141/g.16485  ORF Transcript_9141/g.16485 Transcript_9141/m.16485 type:complete len:202 (-) Transcript_9141:816-1421(-)